MRAKGAKDAIIAVVDDIREDSLSGIGIYPADSPFFYEEQLYETVEDCIGFSLSDLEKRLCLVAFAEGQEIAKQSIWY